MRAFGVLLMAFCGLVAANTAPPATPATIAGAVIAEPANAVEARLGRDSAAEQTRARAYLKEHLQQLGKTHPFAEWERKLDRFAREAENFRARKPLEGPFNPALKRDFQTLAAQLDTLQRIRPKVETLIREMYVQVVLGRVEERFRRDGIPLSPAGREAFYQTLKPYEAGSLRPRTDFLARLVSLDKGFTQAYSAWLFEWAKKAVSQRIDAHLRSVGFAALDSAHRELALKGDYWARQVEADAAQAAEELKAAGAAARARAPGALIALENLRTLLSPEMLLSELLEQAQSEGLSFTVEAEARVESALLARQENLQRPVEEKIRAWKALEPGLKAALAKAETAAARQARLARQREEQERAEQRKLEAQARAREERERLEQDRLEAQARAREEQERRERERLEALAEEQRRAEEAQREEFRKSVAAWKNMAAAGNGLGIDSATQSALGTRAARLKTSAVGSGRVKLKVESSKFSDTLAFVEKFTVADTRIDLSKMSLEEKASQSAYVYASPSGRTTPTDLDHFVQNVALGSFEAYYGFLSYRAPERWRPGRPLAWKPARAADPVARDREYSYVDLVVDAHRKRNRRAVSAAERRISNVPANMIVIFEPRGGIRRFQSFSDIRQVAIRKEDLSGGRLHYKFLNYGADRENIYLNGIDSDIQVAVPEG